MYFKIPDNANAQRRYLVVHAVTFTSNFWMPAAVAQRSRAGLLIGKSGFDSPLTLTACGPSDGKEVKDVFGRPGDRVEVGSAR